MRDDGWLDIGRIVGRCRRRCTRLFSLHLSPEAPGGQPGWACVAPNSGLPLRVAALSPSPPPPPLPSRHRTRKRARTRSATCLHGGTWVCASARPWPPRRQSLTAADRGIFLRSVPSGGESTGWSRGGERVLPLQPKPDPPRGASGHGLVKYR